MSTDTRSYYEKQLDSIDFTPTAEGYPAHAIFGSAGKTTKALAITAESAAAIVAKLCAVFMFPAERPAAVAPAPAKTRLYVAYKIGRDANGNKLVKVSTSGRGGFSIQTNGNLPQTDRDGVTTATDAEVCAYVSKHGTWRQRRILDI
jgi:hypothetical protein